MPASGRGETRLPVGRAHRAVQVTPTATTEGSIVVAAAVTPRQTIQGRFFVGGVAVGEGPASDGGKWRGSGWRKRLLMLGCNVDGSAKGREAEGDVECVSQKKKSVHACVPKEVHFKLLWTSEKKRVLYSSSAQPASYPYPHYSISTDALHLTVGMNTAPPSRHHPLQPHCHLHLHLHHQRTEG